MTDCHAKVRFATKEFAESVIREQQSHRVYVPKAGQQHRAYFCRIHGAWHTGNSRAQQRWEPSNAQQDTLGRLSHLRGLLIAEFGATKRPDTWRGVRALSGAIRHLQTHP